LIVISVGWGGPVLAVGGCLNLVAALGVSLRARWGLLLEVLLGVVLCALTGSITLFCVLILVSMRGSLDDPMLGIGIAGVLNGWASIALCGLFLAAGVVMIATAWRGIGNRAKDRPVAEHR
jgi:hypothetical protein